MSSRGRRPAEGMKAKRPRLAAQGGAVKRTPQSVADPAAHKSTYKVKDIVGHALQDGVKKWKVRWEGFDERGDTFEPLEHLAGCENFIARYEQELKEKLAADARVAAEKQQERGKKKKEAEEADDDVSEVVVATPKAATAAIVDEMATYLNELEKKMVYKAPDGSIVKFDLLQWWKNNQHQFPSVARMARQYLAFPSTSAGVERLFSKAGKMYDDLSKNTQDETLKHSLMAASNYVPEPPKYKPSKAIKKI